MGRPRKDRVSICITLSKEVLENADGIIEAINQVHEEKNLPKVTRSDFIETLIVQFIVAATKQENSEKAKEEEKNNA